MRFKTGLTLLALLAVAVGSGFYLLTTTSQLPAAAFVQRTADLANGATMFNAGGCASCHATPEQDDGTKLGGGLALATAFGTFKVPNISSHPTAGIGAWSEQEFASAVLKGVGRMGEQLYPAFPYTSYQRMRLDDVRDLFAYIKTLPAVATPSLPHELKFPFTIRRGVGLWKRLFLDGQTFMPDPAKDPVFNRGAYLVEGPGHCAECHSPRNFAGAIVPDRRFSGGLDPNGKDWIPNITPHADGLPDWSADDIAYLLQTGTSKDNDSVAGSMADVVINMAKLPDADRKAMAIYIKALPARPGQPPPKPPEPAAPAAK